MHFATLPPELNSARMHSGPGALRFTYAAEAWDALAGRLRAMAEAYAPLAALPSAAAMASWLTAIAGQAEEAAAGAVAAGEAYETAVAATVAPAVIEANRAHRTHLATTDPLGRAASTIADLDAQYDRMWLRNAEALYGYAGATARATALTPFSPPPGAWRAGASDGWQLAAAPDVISTGRQVMPAISEALAGLACSPLKAFTTSLSPVTSSLSRLSSLSAPPNLAIGHLNALNKNAALRVLFPTPDRDVPAVAAARGHAASVGALSVPPAWTRAAAPAPVAAMPARWHVEPVRLVVVSEEPYGRQAAIKQG